MFKLFSCLFDRDIGGCAQGNKSSGIARFVVNSFSLFAKGVQYLRDGRSVHSQASHQLEPVRIRSTMLDKSDWTDRISTVMMNASPIHAICGKLIWIDWYINFACSAPLWRKQKRLDAFLLVPEAILLLIFNLPDLNSRSKYFWRSDEFIFLHIIRLILTLHGCAIFHVVPWFVTFLGFHCWANS